MTADATIDYDSLQQEALRGVVRAVLNRVAKSGLPGDHHLYISFDVRAPGVVLSKRLREKYPHEMTIVLQHRFWDLSIGEERFEVKLTFDGIPERLVVPFDAIKVFLAPSVRYVLHFEDAQAVASDAGDADGDDTRTNGARAAKKPRSTRPKTRSEREASGDISLTAVSNTAPTPLQKPAAAALLQAKPKLAPPVAAASAVAPAAVDAPSADQPAPSAQVVSLDAFRKK